ncbi:Tetratricopeptide repeat protein 39B [Rhizopus stolonifer]|uniref:Tetratricopeptide repeat protein 39B n=1 Tax=Rhizopus stolonifer TaxID=4846 RepID=A0A367JQG0_RHIST|nr:Tetratricopeptide repeat protein 39B [Rhizopus stolonifer]
MASTCSEQKRIEEITSVLKNEIKGFPSPKRFIPSEPELKKTTGDLRQCGANLNKKKKASLSKCLLMPTPPTLDENIMQGFNLLLNNQFMAAKMLFEQKSNEDPLSALAVTHSLIAVMTSSEQDQTMALNALNTTYDIANTQIDLAKTSSKLTDYIPGYLKKMQRPQAYPANGVLRAHVLKAECCLQIAILQLLQESMIGYVKCGLNLRRAYSSYSFVWQEYKKMGTDHLAIMDSDTLSGVRFGIGSVHLVLSALPAKILKAISAFGWKPDRQLGFALLNECAQMRRVRSPMATMMLLAYYVSAISFAPQIMTDVYKKTAMDTLLDAQKEHPDSVVYLYFAGRMARQSLDLPLSTQSFLYATQVSQNEWAELAVTNACRFEIAMNHMITGNWQQAANAFAYLTQQQYWSAAFCHYAQGACYDMMGDRAQAVLLFAQIPYLAGKKLSDIDTYVLRKVTMFQQSGYQNLHFFSPLLEFMCIWNLFTYMSPELLILSLNRIQTALASIQKAEQAEQEERMKEIAPDAPVPNYFDERACLLVIKSSMLNALGRAEDITLDINWVIDHKEHISQDTWTVPYALWEAGISCQSMNLKQKCRQVWEMALDHGKHDFEHRLAIRLNLALTRLEEE